MLPFFEEHGIRLLRVLTDRGTEYCGLADGAIAPGRWCFGKAPLKTFLDSVGLGKKEDGGSRGLTRRHPVGQSRFTGHPRDERSDCPIEYRLLDFYRLAAKVRIVR
ncbi:MAG: hypothetical protein KIS78_25225 [Labilithrix sp.]|nr:hypothetical protein [Labilithrix sp.]